MGAGEPRPYDDSSAPPTIQGTRTPGPPTQETLCHHEKTARAAPGRQRRSCGGLSRGDSVGTRFAFESGMQQSFDDREVDEGSERTKAAMHLPCKPFNEAHQTQPYDARLP